MSGDSGYRAFSTQHHIMIRQETIDTILERTDIVTLIGEHVHLRKCGSRYVGCCPFHNEKTPSFVVSPSKGVYKCFGCGKGGGVISFIMEIENLSFIEAVRLLAEGKTCRVVALQGENYVDYDITEALQMTKSLDQHTYEVMRALTGVH